MAIVEYFGYDDCIALENDSTRVVLCPHGGGRVLEYALYRTNAIYLPSKLDSQLEAPTDDPSPQEGWKHTPGVNDDGPAGGPAGGRFDIGPEMLNPPRPTLWLGSYRAEIIGPRSASLTSAPCDATGVQLIRRFELAETGSQLLVTQVIRNVSDTTKQYFHWSRSFAHGGGRVLIPLSEGSRYPSKYIMYGNDGLITAPSDPNIQERDGFLEILGTPAAPYGEIANFPLCIFYYKDTLVELEPIGPRETIPAGAEASFTEEWHLLPMAFPVDGDQIDLAAFTRTVEMQTAARGSGGGTSSRL